MPPAFRHTTLHKRLSLGVALVLASTAHAESPYDLMARSFGALLDPADADAWPAKVRAIAGDEYHFWRGTRDLFYDWCHGHCQDWHDDAAAYVVCQGDLHLGNLGSFASVPFGTTALGLVDFDESARLPFQIELLQGVLTFDLLARENGVPLTAADKSVLHEAFFDAYATALAFPPADTGLAAMLDDHAGRPYAFDLNKFTRGGRFKTEVVKNGVVTDRLRPPDAAIRNGLAAALAEAVQHDARLAALLRPYDAADFEACLLDAARRTRVDSSGSQGLSKLLILLRRPFKNSDVDGILYLKQQVPTAAERVGFVPPVPGPPGRRCVRDLDALTHGRSLAASWCDLAGRSYWVSIKEPWSDEPSGKAVHDFASLVAAARVCARVVADAHAADATRLLPQLTPAVRATIADRAAAYAQWQTRAYMAFRADTRVQGLLPAQATDGH